jgi:hypothetical protein
VLLAEQHAPVVAGTHAMVLQVSSSVNTPLSWLHWLALADRHEPDGGQQAPMNPLSPHGIGHCAEARYSPETAEQSVSFISEQTPAAQQAPEEAQLISSQVFPAV